MKRRSIRAVASLSALSIVAAGWVVGGTVSAGAVTTVATQNYTIGNGSVSSPTAVAQPDVAGETANYTVGFTTPTALSGGSATVTISDPANVTTFPATQTDYFVVDTTNASGNQPVASVAVASGGHGVTLGLSASVSAGDSLSVFVIGATNPSSPGSYNLDVSTSQNPIAASTATYQIVAAASAPSFNPAATPPIVGGSSAYTIGAFPATAALSVGGQIKISSFAGAGTNDNIAFPTSSSDYKINDLTTSASSAAPSAVAVAAVGSGDTGQSVTLTVADAITSGDELSVTVSGVQNPSSTQTDSITAAAPSTATAVTGNLQIGTSLGSPTISLSQVSAGATGVEYTVGFKATSAIASGGSISFVAPAGTSFSGAGVTLVDATNSAASASVASGSIHASTGPSSSSENELSFTVPNAINAGDNLFIEVTGVTNPAAGTYGGSAGNFTVASSADVIPAGVPSYTVTAAAAPVLASIEVNPNTPAVTSQYTIGNLQASAAFTSGSSTIELHAPSGTTFPSATSDYNIADLTNTSASANPSSLTGGGTDDVVLTVGANIASGDFITVVVSSVTNPSAGNYSMSVIANLTAAVPPTTTPPTPPPPGHGHGNGNGNGNGNPTSLATGTLVLTAHGAYVAVQGQLLRVRAVRVLVVFRLGGRHGRLQGRWGTDFRFGSQMGKRIVEFKVGPNDWIRWNGRIDRVRSISQFNGKSSGHFKR